MIQGIGFLDVSECAATWVRVYKQKMKDEGDGRQTMILRGAESDAPVLKEWASARKLLQRMKNEAAPYLGGKAAVLGKASVLVMKPQAFTQWRVDDDPYTAAHIRTMTCLVPSPLALIYSGGAAANLAVGTVTVVGQHMLHSMVNLGVNAACYLIVDLCRPDED